MSYIFVFMIATSVVCAFFTGNTQALSDSVITGAEDAVTLIITMTGMICLWSGVMEVAKESRLTDKVSKLLSPLLSGIFPDVKRDSRAFSYICMNVSANVLGIGNAATPLGIKAMEELKTDESEVATDSMVNFVILNTASVQLLPTTIAALRASHGSKSPFDIIVCVWVVSVVALAVGLMSSKIFISAGKRLCR